MCAGVTGIEYTSKKVKLERSAFAFSSKMEHFERAAAQVTAGELPALSDANKLRLYGLFSVAKKGIDPGPAPSMLSFRAAAKHSAWANAAAVHTPESARDAYIALVVELELASPEKDSVAGGGWGKEAPTGFEIGRDDTDGDRTTRDVCHWAAVGNAREVARELQTSTALRDHRDADGLTPLMRAADRGHIAVLDVLISAGADLALADEDGLTALHYAALCGHASAAGALVRAGAPLDIRDNDSSTPLESAADDDTRAAIDAAREACLSSGFPPSFRTVAALAALAALVLAVTLAFWRTNTGINK